MTQYETATECIPWRALRGSGEDALGFIPFMVLEDDPRPAAEQFNDRYSHGGGWRPMKGWTQDKETFAIQYPADAPMKPLAFGKLRNEIICVYESAWVAITNLETGTFEVSRMD